MEKWKIFNIAIYVDTGPQRAWWELRGNQRSGTEALGQQTTHEDMKILFF